MTLEEIWNSLQHNEVKKQSNTKWLNEECKNCRAMAYNEIINDLMGRLQKYFDPFI